ncbi:MAG: hypothetical protein IK999_18875 [Ruminococcus sp.]|nr:hypothetical protein [Ruminococcus sp.]
MNVIEKVRELLAAFPKIAEVLGDIHVDFSDGNADSYSLSSTGDTLISEDIIGNQRRQHTFLLAANYSAINDYERISSSGILLELAVWLSKQKDLPVETPYNGVSYPGEITLINAANGMLYAVPQENSEDTYMYQLTITAVYTVDFTNGGI